MEHLSVGYNSNSRGLVALSSSRRRAIHTARALILHPRNQGALANEICLREGDAMHGALDAKRFGLGQADLYAQVVAIGEEAGRQRLQPPQPDGEGGTCGLMLELGVRV